ncbi:MAG: GNAT family N-acetyltransferase [Saprospiraceae bacterium]|nr:GNAT family N-acetyltransferase [Saprospiraceae bacterium]
MLTKDYDYLSLFDFASPSYDESIALRHDILRAPLNLAFDMADLQTEWDSYHLGYFNGLDQLLGCLVLKPVQDATWKMRQVAVCQSFQGQGIGKRLVKTSEALAVKMNIRQFCLHARETAIPFYLDLGYVISSEPFTEVGIQHAAMSKLLIT